MGREDWLRAAEILETELKLTEQKRVMVLHEKQGRIHAHVVWERYDHDKGRMISDSYSRLAQDRARKTMEKELEHSQTPHRNKREPNIKKDLTELWQKTKAGAEFIKAAAAKGYAIAKSNLRRPFMVVDQDGRSFDLVRQLDKVKTKEVHERLRDEKLPTEKAAIKAVRTNQSQKPFTWMQEQFADRIEKYKESKAAKQEEKELFKEKLLGMQDTGASITNDQSDSNITQSQNKMDAMLQTFRNKDEQNNPEQSPTETQREKKLREFKEQLEKKQNQKNKNRGLEI